MNDMHPEFPDAAPGSPRESGGRGGVPDGETQLPRAHGRHSEPGGPPFEDRPATPEPTGATGQAADEAHPRSAHHRAAGPAPAQPEDEEVDVYPDEAAQQPDAAAEYGTDFLFANGRPDPAVRKRRRRRRNIVMLVVLAAFAVVIVGAVIFVQGLLGPGEPEDFAGPGEGEVTFTVEPGWGPLQIGGHLTDQGIVASKQLFAEAIQEVDAENKEIHPGEYQLKYKMPALDAATVLVGGDDAKVNYVGIRQNLRTDAVFKEINKATGIAIAELEALNKKPAAFGLEKPVKNLEGFLHPGEYRFPLGTPAKGILQLMVDATLEELQDQGVTDPAEQYRILKIASILQAESRPEDYATVSGALENRLHPNNKETGGLLQVDSSVIYGLDRYTLQISQAEKEDAGNPYNTYVHPGLPPTPIGSPADSAIEAAIHPENNDYYYWVTVNTQTGETKFAKTYAQHRVYQNQFRTWCQQNADVCK